VPDRKKPAMMSARIPRGMAQPMMVPNRPRGGMRSSSSCPGPFPGSGGCRNVARSGDGDDLFSGGVGNAVGDVPVPLVDQGLPDLGKFRAEGLKRRFEGVAVFSDSRCPPR
jgi:hypothetical protein